MTYVTPSVGQPYQIGIKYGGEDIPGSPFEMSSNPDLDDVTGTGIPVQSSGKTVLPPGWYPLKKVKSCQALMSANLSSWISAEWQVQIELCMEWKIQMSHQLKD